ncbi:amidase [Saccharolobus solfataricus]|uniref:Glutamyl-tRNA amidotransferase, subunit A (GatA-1) n=3 Tax=Saccharolobus solfataricus TaxID=2287 RepID=Q7LXK0_SACS2|nr:amidase [Saccharolobus solfataricus]AAK41062.1 Glutamyl-tRNA amidotransferase, subunit A (gatA-1) [Saccharolobus solfataricus P2]AKA74085.1 amidase [Saccharolobus solfataricus]AKA76782.1 amidase [Saccharolobus solfataricus]AKA79476.1 amidase [Saccharolobus solfataricus]AZF68564.1 amidase [Saccharolobus solfataricus]
MKLEELNSKYNAFITLHTIEEGNDKGKLKDVTFGIKDVILTKDVRTTAGSRVLENYVPQRNAYVVDAILREGGKIIGKTNTHEFALGATNTSSIGGPARNPVDPERISGGSSGGSAVAVKLDMVDVGIGTDTGGSVRIPSSLCGVIGFKPTTGLIPNDGVIPFSWSLDTVGIIVKDNIRLLRRVFDVVLPNEKRKVEIAKLRTRPRLGLFLFDDMEVSRILLKDIYAKLSSHFDIVEVDLPLLRQYGSKTRRTISLAEAASYHKDWISEYSDKYFKDTYTLLLDGMKISATDYIDALRHRRVLIEEYVKVFKNIDFILSPTTKIVAPRISDVISNPLQFREYLIANTELFNVVGAPSISVPFSTLNDLPAGLMISGELYKDGDLLEVAEYILNIVGKH